LNLNISASSFSDVFRFAQLRIQAGCHGIGLMALAQVSIPHRHSKTGMTHQSVYRRQVRTSHKKVTGEAMT
jgi:hypothetical protein